MGFVYKLHHPKDPQKSTLRIQIYNTWSACSSATEFLNFIFPDIECPHARLYLLNECYKVYIEEQNKLDEEREAKRKLEQEREQAKKAIGITSPTIIKGVA